MKLKHFILFIFLLGFQNVFAQNNFSGKVLDAISHKPLASASITVGAKKVTTNIAGEFSMTVTGADRIVITYIGYEKLSKVLYNN